MDSANNALQRDALWIKFSRIPFGSAGWRMGVGEDYWYAFQDWFNSLSVEARAEVIAQQPEPEGWEGFYARTIEHFARRVR